MNDHSYVCPVPDCKPENHDICICGHERMVHLELPRKEGGGCWGEVSDCWPRCLTFELSTEEESMRFFEAYMAASPDDRMDQEQADKFRQEFLSKRTRD